MLKALFNPNALANWGLVATFLFVMNSGLSRDDQLIIGVGLLVVAVVILMLKPFGR